MATTKNTPAQPVMIHLESGATVTPEELKDWQVGEIALVMFTDWRERVPSRAWTAEQVRTWRA